MKRWVIRGVQCVLMFGLFISSMAAAQDEEDDAIVVYADRFKRWDETRWLIKTEVVLPKRITLEAKENYEVRIVAYQMRMIIRCAKDWKITGRRWEVNCKLEDIGIQIVPFREDANRTEKNQVILDELYADLKGATLQMQVMKNGRVDNIDLEGISVGNRKERNRVETVRQLIFRMMAGFDMKLRKNNFLKTGQWVEYRSPLMDMPGSMRANMGSALIVHQLDPYMGHLIVQTVGKGSLKIDDTAGESYGDVPTYGMVIEGVSVYEKEGGFMTDRVWYVAGRPTANFFASSNYFQAGRLRMLGENQQVNVGPTRQVSMPGYSVGDLETWSSIDVDVHKERQRVKEAE